MQIYVINLASRPDRLAFMSKQLDALNLPFTRIDAVDGLGDDDIGYPADHPCLAKVQFACYLSHIKLLRKFISSNEPYCLILEDDVKLAKRLPEVLNHEPLFSHGKGVTRLERRTTKSWLTRRAILHFKDFKIHRTHWYEGGAGAIVITRDFALSFLANYAEPKIPIDDQMVNPTNLPIGSKGIYQLVPAVATQRLFLAKSDPDYNSSSDIFGARFIGAPAVLSKKPTQIILRELKRRKLNFQRNVFQIQRIIPFDQD